MNYGPIIFWICVCILIGAILYPLVRFLRQKDRPVVGWVAVFLGMALTVYSIFSIFVMHSAGQTPIFLGMIGECFLGIDDSDLEC